MALARQEARGPDAGPGADGGVGSAGSPAAPRGPGTFVWFALLLLAAELLAAWRLPYRHLPRAADVPRNVRSHRGFPEYLQPPERRPGPVRGERPLAVVIGNSQAVGVELGDPEGIWFAHLRRRLSADAAGGAPVHVENWSHGGLRTGELELLTLAALERGPDLLVFVLHFRNFDPLDDLRLSATSSDVPLLAGRPSLWPGLRGTLIEGELDLDARLLKAVLLHSSFARMRNPVLDRLSHVVPPPWHRAVFGHRRDPGDVFHEGRRHSTEGMPTLERRARWVAQGGLDEALEEIARLDDVRVGRRAASATAVTASIARLAAAQGTPVVWVWGPVDGSVIPDALADRPRAFYAAATGAARATGARVVDLTDALPHDAFVSLTHFGVEGHQAMAALMEPVIRDALP